MLTCTRSPSVPHSPPPFAPQARILEWGHPHGNFSVDFEGPQDAKDLDGFRVFDIEPCSRRPISRRAAATSSRATIGLADRGGSEPTLMSGLMPLCFSLYCELCRVPGIGESQSRPAIVVFLSCLLSIPYLVLLEGAPNCPKWVGPGMRWRW